MSELKFRNASAVRRFINDRVGNLKFSVRSQLAILGSLEGKTLDDIQQLFIVQVKEGDREKVMNALAGTNAYLKAPKPTLHKAESLC